MSKHPSYYHCETPNEMKGDSCFAFVVVATDNFFPLKLFYYTPRSVTQDTISCHRQNVVVCTVGCAIGYSWHCEYFYD